MNTAAPFLARLISSLDAAGIEHMVAGSFASTYDGMPRTTHDIDIVIRPKPRGLKALLQGLPEEEYHWSEEAALEALRPRGQFNVIDLETGWKVDLLMLKQREFSATEFDRRLAVELFGVPVMVATAEDTVISKPEWSRASRSERQLRDVAGVLAVVGDSLDVAPRLLSFFVTDSRSVQRRGPADVHPARWDLPRDSANSPGLLPIGPGGKEPDMVTNWPGRMGVVRTVATELVNRGRERAAAWC